MSNLYATQLRDLTSRRAFDLAQTRAYAYLDSIDGRPVFPTEAALGDLARFDEALPQAGGAGRGSGAAGRTCRPKGTSGCGRPSPVTWPSPETRC
jgi:hypothetical protein